MRKLKTKAQGAFLALLLVLLVLTGCSGTSPPQGDSGKNGPLPTEESAAESTRPEPGEDTETETQTETQTETEAGASPDAPGNPAQDAADGNTADGNTADGKTETGDPAQENTGAANDPDTTAQPEPKAPDTTAANSPEPTTQPTVTITIQGPVGTPPLRTAAPVALRQGDTVLDLLQRMAKEQRLHLSVRGSGRAGYVEAIDNLYEFDQGPGSGWMYSVNGAFPDRSSGEWEPEDGDTVVWWYTLDAGKDVREAQP
ncbi:DUF4430 domain-containing protein [Anaerotalea alkaliphila]|uniref:DUF4430 domain-containing protein n=1 Tax=Anaerotalea alkaliphila TaxID=2662126 RepID=A0A7X5HVC1_9FIRM|nr:DUF4430 domain-containing protein [Anaerotalea alkaliphila]NDL67181.1 DUF4430 domain-containing protein [Anaerotalea alkaliphila]